MLYLDQPVRQIDGSKAYFEPRARLVESQTS